MLHVDNLSVRLGGRLLMDGVTFRISEGQRVALAGRNGQGKSTFFRVLTGEVGADRGKVDLGNGRRVGYLPQEINPPDSDVTAVKAVLEALGEVKKLEAEVERCIALMCERPEDEKVIEAYGRAQARFEELGGYDADARARTIMNGLGFTQARMDKLVRELSGGWLMRVELARLLLEAPDLLILDEPTNHLDIEAREWLLDYLKTFPGAVLLTSHDRYFLDALVERILELELGRVEVYHGNYSYFEVEKPIRRQRLKASFERQQKEIKAHEVFIAKNRAHPATSKMAQSRVKQLEKIVPIVLPPEPPKDLKLRFPDAAKSGNVVFRLEGVSKSYGDLQVFSEVNLELVAGTRLAVVGANGAGKTTLLNILAQRLEPSSGSLTLGHNVKLQYFSQYTDDLDEDDTRSVLQWVDAAAPPESPIPIRTLLGCFLFSGDDVFKLVRVLSGGERARLKIARMLLQPGNVLVLDEPTNHLDLHSQGVLLKAVKNFGGTVIFVSHDRQFVSELATAVLHIEDGRVTEYPCDYEQYRWQLAQKKNG
ncbi:MAG: ABC-F family ATP-binding cassette domain-containing protein [Planctomycetes bacterium]|nr:ABC-F family ATP-binding cassette domain-containing protein [Planctomycetota bacterium]